MLIFRCGIVVLPCTYFFSLCFQVAKDSNSMDIGLAFLYVASGVIAGKILFDRYQQIHILGALTPNPHVTSFTNRIASCSALFVSVGFLLYLLLFLLKVDDHCLTALSIFICGFCTLYLWTQCIITTYASTQYYDQNVAALRQYIANVSFLVLIIMAIVGIVTSFSPKSASGLYICFVVTSLCNYTLAAIFCVFILSFEKEYRYFAEGLRSDMLIDDACSLGEDCTDRDSLFGTQEVISSTMVIKTNIACAKTS